LTFKRSKTASISGSAYVRIDHDLGDSEHHHYLGTVSEFLSSAYKFDRREKRGPIPVISIDKSSPKIHRAVNLAEAKNRSREWANGRGDIEGTPQYFKRLATVFAERHGLNLTIFSGEELLAQGFRLLHAVGRGSANEPVFVNISYNGNPNSDKWTAFVGKGVCFDTGGYQLKTSKINSIQPLESRRCTWISMALRVFSRLSRPLFKRSCR
jgi:leucyl aminopeptidase